MPDRREFLGLLGMTALGGLELPHVSLRAQPRQQTQIPIKGRQAESPKDYGSGYFGKWMTDQFGLPAYRYTCDQTKDPRALTPVHKEWRSAADHTHQVGNDRLVALASNYGYIQVRQDE